MVSTSESMGKFSGEVSVKQICWHVIGRVQMMEMWRLAEAEMRHCSGATLLRFPSNLLASP